MNLDCRRKGEMCGGIVWYSDATHRSYAITQNTGELSTAQMFKNIGGNNRSMLPLLFYGACN